MAEGSILGASVRTRTSLDIELRDYSIERRFDQFSGDHSDCEPPDPISNSEVKPISADDSVGLPM